MPKAALMHLCCNATMLSGFWAQWLTIKQQDYQLKSIDISISNKVIELIPVHCHCTQHSIRAYVCISKGICVYKVYIVHVYKVCTSSCWTWSVGGYYRLSIKCAINWIASHFITATHHFVSFNTTWRFTCALSRMINGLIDCKLLLVLVSLSVCVCVSLGVCVCWCALCQCNLRHHQTACT